MKESNSVQVAIYAKSNGINDEPAFAWCVPHVLKKADRIISKIKARLKHTTHKYGVRLPRIYKYALELDKKNGNNLW